MAQPQETVSGAPFRRVDDPGRAAVVAALDVLAWPFAIVVASVVADADQSSLNWVAEIAVAAAAQLGIGYAVGLYRRRFRPSSFEEIGALAVTTVFTGLAVLGIDLLIERQRGLGLGVLVATVVALVLQFGQRYVRRLRARAIAWSRVRHRLPVVVIGAGEGGERAINAMLNTHSPYRPVALLDDDPSRRQVHILKLKVEGTSADLAHVARRHDAGVAVIAIPSAGVEDLRRLYGVVRAAGLEAFVLPPVQRLMGPGTTAELTRLSDEEVLRRQMVEIDMDQVRALVTGRRVVVTGAGGSIGSELSRQIAALAPEQAVLVDHDDSLLHTLRGTIAPEHQPACRYVLGDVRDADRLHEVFAQVQPALVFHAAALKHLPALEDAPGEGWKTNVEGTANVLAAAEKVGVERVVNISTDKAADPTSVLGLSKRIAERITADAASRVERPYVSVRFGNVIGSRGSVLETFEAQVRAGGPLTVTDPEVTRYFMAVREAVRLTLQAAAIGSGGQVLVLDMGSPVKIVDVARQVIEQSGTPAEIVFTGLRPGEKLHEVLLSTGEVGERPLHPLIDHIPVPPLDLMDAVEACQADGLSPQDPDGMRAVAGYGVADVPPPPTQIPKSSLVCGHEVGTTTEGSAGW